MRTRAWVLPVVAAGLLALAAVLPGHAEAPRSPHSAAVTQSTYACPVSTGGTVVTGRFADRPTARVSAVQLPSGANERRLAAASGWNAAPVDAGALLVATSAAPGSGPVGFVGSEGTTATGGGLAVESCPGIVHEAWFVGAGSGRRHFSTLVLTNLSSTPAVANIALWGLSGPVDPINADAIVLEPKQTRSIELDALAAGEAQLALRVRSLRGALAVSVRDTSTAVFAGSEALAPSVAPTRTQVVAGLAAGADQRQLHLVNPGQITARVRIEVLGRNGALVPAGLEAVKAEAGKVTEVDIPESVGKDAQGWRLTADQPVAASVRMARSSQDFAHAVSRAPLSGPALAPVRLGGLLDGVRLDLTAPRAAAAVTVTAYDKDMQAQGATTVRVAADSTVSLNLAKKNLFAKGLDALAYVAVTPRGKVLGSVVYTAGTGLSVLPLQAAPLTGWAPDVRPAR